MALFGGASDGRREPRSLVEFRAGKMTLSRGTVTADTRKGLVYMKTSDSLLHFCWKDRQAGDVVDVSLRARTYTLEYSLTHARASFLSRACG